MAGAAAKKVATTFASEERNQEIDAKFFQRALIVLVEISKDAVGAFGLLNIYDPIRHCGAHQS